MTTSHSSRSRIEYKEKVIRGKYLQPLDESERKERLSKNGGKIGQISRRLEDEWYQCEIDDRHSSDRDGMIKQVVDDLVWFDDLNHREWVRQKIIESDLFKKWDGTEDDIDDLITESYENKGAHDHYSVYREYFDDDTIDVTGPQGGKAKLSKKERKNADDDESDDDDEDNNGSGKQFIRRKENPVDQSIGDPDKNKNLLGEM